MSQTFMRGLALLELVDSDGPIGVSELARRLGTDKSSVSRMVTIAEADGWVIKINGHVAIGPRAAMLGLSSPTARSVRAAEPLLNAIAGVTGLWTQLIALVGDRAVILASTTSPQPAPTGGMTTALPLWAGAAPKVIAAQLDPGTLDRLIPADPLADPRTVYSSHADLQLVVEGFAGSATSVPAATTTVSTRAQLLAQLADIRRTGMFRERGEILPEASCIAVPYRHVGVPAALMCLGTLAEVDRDHRLIEAVLRAAAVSGATRDDVVTAAAHAINT